MFISTRIIHVILILGMSATLGACRSEAEREREGGQNVQTKTVIAPDGSIHLTAEQAQTNGIQTAAVVEQPVSPTITAIGRVKPRAGGESEVFSPFAGRLIVDPARLPRVGISVTKGQVVAEVEQQLPVADKVQLSATAAQLQSQITQAQQEVDLRRIELERARRLYEGGAIPLKQVQTAEFNVKQAESRLAAAKSQKALYEAALSAGEGPRRIQIRAPISGTVVAADVVPGMQIDASKSLMTIADLSTVWIEVAVHESQLPLVAGAPRIEFTSPAVPGRTFTGTLVTTGGTVDPANRTITAVFSVTNSGGALKLEMTAEARITTGPTSNALLIPSSAVLFEESQALVFVETEPNVYYRRTISTGNKSGDNIVVTSGLKVGERVVTIGAQALRSETQKGQIPAEGEGERR